MTIGSANKITVKVKKKPTVFVNQSGLVTRRLSDLADVNINAKEDGSLLIYDEETEQFVASKILNKQEMNGGHF